MRGWFPFDIIHFLNADENPEHFVISLENLAGINSWVGSEKGVVLKQDDMIKQDMAALKSAIVSIDPDNKYGDVKRVLPCDITLDLGSSSIFFNWKFDRTQKGETQQVLVMDAIEKALYTDTDGIFSEAVTAFFGEEIPYSNIQSVELRQFQEGAKAGIFEVEFNTTRPYNGMTKGSFIIYSSKVPSKNPRTIQEYITLKKLAAINPEYVCPVYAKTKAIALGPDIKAEIQIFADKKLDGYFEVSALLRELEKGEEFIAAGGIGVGLILNPGGKDRSRGDANVGGLEVEEEIKRQMLEIITVYSDPDKGELILTKINNGDFLCMIDDQGRPHVKLVSCEAISDRKYAFNQGEAGAFFIQSLLLMRENDIRGVQGLSDLSNMTPQKMLNDIVFEPELVLNTVFETLSREHGPAKARSMMIVWLQYHATASFEETSLSTFGNFDTDYSFIEAEKFLQKLLSSQVPDNNDDDVTEAEFQLRDIRETEELALNFVESILSKSATKKIVLAFEEGIGGANSTDIFKVIEYIEALKKDNKYKDYLKDFEILSSSASGMSAKIDPFLNNDTEVFMFARNDSREDLRNVEGAVHASYVDEWNDELLEDAYHPLFEIVTISLGQYLSGNTLNKAERLLNDLNIESITPDNGALIFKLLPEPKKIGKREVQRKYASLKRLLKAA